MPEAKGERIAKVMARAGLCSRREAERWIAEGRVAIDGTVLESPAVTVPEGARVTVDGKPLPAPEPTRPKLRSGVRFWLGSADFRPRRCLSTSV